MKRINWNIKTDDLRVFPVKRTKKAVGGIGILILLVGSLIPAMLLMNLTRIITTV